MFFLFEVASQNLILGDVPETLGLLVFGVGLVLLAIGLRTILRRVERNAESEMTHITK